MVRQALRGRTSLGARAFRTLTSWAWVPIPAFVLAIAVLRVADLRTPHEAAHLLALLNFTLCTAVSVIIAVLAAGTFLATGAWGALFLGSGVLVMGAGFLAAGLAGGDRPDVTTTVHNTAMLAAGLLHLGGVWLSLRPRRPAGTPLLLLSVFYLGALFVVGVVHYLSYEGWAPAFFVQGRGGTHARDAVLIVAISSLAASGLIVARMQDLYESFRHWYGLGLELLSVGLMGIMLQPSLGSPISWVGRAAQYLGGVYLLAAAIVSAQQTRRWALPLELALQQAEDRFARASARERALVAEVAELQQARLQGLSRRMNEAELVVDLDGRIVETNDRASVLYGRSHSELLRAQFHHLCPEGTPRGVIAQVRAAGEGIRFETEHLRRDGSRFPVAVSSRAFDLGGHTFLHCLVRDLSDQHRQDAEIRLLAEITRGSQDALLVLGPDLRILRCAGDVEKVLGFAEEDCVGKRAAELFAMEFPDDDREAHRARLGALQRSRICVRLRKRDGRVIDADVVVSPRFDTAKRPEGFFAVVRDISTQKDGERALRLSEERMRALAQRLESAREEEKTRMARDLHDDLGQALTALQLDLGWLEERLEAQPATPWQGELLDRVVAAAEIAAGLQTSVKRIASEARPAALDNLGLEAALRHELHRFELRTELRLEAHLEADAPAGSPEATALFRICQEALTNVVRHAGAGRVELALREQQDALVLEVADDGCGFAGESPRDGPLQLGLLGMRERVRALGGTLEVGPGPLGGTVVRARVPRRSLGANG
ncbi:MAG TPA: PAS domain S-box protein [Anaeromyxobacter sp.]|nr:PAS domain S-box protein [Anaeromyxobacter sp.]